MAYATEQKPTDEFLEKVQKAIADSFKAEAERIFEEHKESMIRELDESKDRIVASVMITLMGRVDLENMGTKLVITVESDKIK